MSRPRLIFLGVIILLIIFLPGYSKLQQLKALNRDMGLRIKGLEAENTRLAQRIKRLENDPLYIEKEARRKMGMGKKGEIIYKVTKEKPRQEF